MENAVFILNNVSSDVIVGVFGVVVFGLKRESFQLTNPMFKFTC